MVTHTSFIKVTVKTVVTGNFNSPSQLKNSHRLIFAHRVKKLTSHFRKEHTVNIPHFLISLLLGNNISFDNMKFSFVCEIQHFYWRTDRINPSTIFHDDSGKFLYSSERNSLGGPRVDSLAKLFWGKTQVTHSFGLYLSGITVHWSNILSQNLPSKHFSTYITSSKSNSRAIWLSICNLTIFSDSFWIWNF